MITIAILIAGLIILILAGDYLVRGAVALAERLNISPVIIGLTIVALGTSAPELFVSIQAAVLNHEGMAIGNIVGSNIANVLLVLGAPALFMTINAREKGAGVSLIIMVAVTAALIAMMWTGTITRLGGLVLLALLVAFLTIQFVRAKRARKAGREEEADYHDDVDDVPKDGRLIAAYILAGIVGLPIGAYLTVESAAVLARFFGISETAIGLTIVAIGTSLPELVTSLMSAVRKSASVAIGNVIGSNIFNIGLILGVTSFIHPLPVDNRLLEVDVWVLAGVTLLVLFLAARSISIKKLGGAAMLIAYGAYIISVF